MFKKKTGLLISLLIALPLTVGCELFVAGPPSDCPDCGYWPPADDTYRSVDFNHGKLELDPISNINFKTHSIRVVSGDCTRPQVEIEILGSIFSSMYEKVSIGFNQLPNQEQEYIIQGTDSKSDSLWFKTGNFYDLPYLVLSQTKIIFKELPESLAVGGSIKFSLDVLLAGGGILKGDFEGIIPTPKTMNYKELTANPNRCVREFNATTNYERERELATKCDQTSDCVLALLGQNKCDYVSVNQNAPNLDLFGIALDEYDRLFPSSAPSLCNEPHPVDSISCNNGYCQLEWPKAIPIWQVPVFH